MKFTGHERDLRDGSNTTDDLDYMHARHYNPILGRFLSVNPGRRLHLDQPQACNAYGYVVSSPLTRVDPDGAEAIAAASVLVRAPALTAPAAAPGLVAAGGFVGGWVIGRQIGKAELAPGYTVDNAVTSGFEWILAKLFAKGGRQNVGDAGLEDLTDEQVSQRARDRTLPSQERRRYQREEKFLRLRNKQKRGEKGKGVVPPPVDPNQPPPQDKPEAEESDKEETSPRSRFDFVGPAVWFWSGR